MDGWVHNPQKSQRFFKPAKIWVIVIAIIYMYILIAPEK